MLTDVIVISKKDKLSVFSTLTAAFDAYGWDDYEKQRRKALPYYRDGYKLERVPSNVSILCFELLMVMRSQESKVSAVKQSSTYLVTIEGYNVEYQVEVAFKEVEEPGEEDGAPVVFDVITHITAIREVYKDGVKVIPWTKWVEDQVIELINLYE